MEVQALATLDNIPKEKAWSMIKKYRKHYHGKEFPGAKYLTQGVWFTFEQLETWIRKAKDEKCTGVRIYFATYLDDEPHLGQDGETKHNYKHRNTIVLIATKKVGDVEMDQYKLVSPNKFNEPLNKGQLCPEECGEALG